MYTHTDTRRYNYCLYTERLCDTAPRHGQYGSLSLSLSLSLSVSLERVTGT